MDLSLVECLKLTDESSDIFKRLKTKDHPTEIKRLLCSYHSIQRVINYIHGECKKYGIEDLMGNIELDYSTDNNRFGVICRVYTFDYTKNKETHIVIYNQLLHSSCSNLIVSSPEELGNVKLLIPPKEDMLKFTGPFPPNVINIILNDNNKKMYESAILNINLETQLEKSINKTKKMKV